MIDLQNTKNADVTQDRPTTQDQAKQVYFVSLGCPKNLVDSQVMLGKLTGANYTVAQEPDDAQIIIINTCSFIDASKEESVNTILELAEYKNSGSCELLVASGCLVQRYANELQKEMPEVDLFIGTGQYHRINELLEMREKSKIEGGPIPNRVYVDQPAFIHTENDERLHTGPKYTGYLKLSEGCNRRCAFCIIPKLRGNVRSRTSDSLVAEAKAMAKAGVRELNLVAQDLTEYGMEWKYSERLETLLPKLAKVEGIEWIRLHYVYPDEFSDELIQIIKNEPKIVKYLDMPIQHTNDRVLKLMNRRLTKENLFKLVAKLRHEIPEIVFRTSMIVGFPTETDQEFEELVDDLTKLNLDHVGVFRYSREEGTKAYDMPDQIHPSVKRTRSKKLTATLQTLAQERNNKLIGTEKIVMFEGPSEESEFLLQARLPTQAQEIDGHVLINETDDSISLGDLKPGQLLRVQITNAMPLDLTARAISVIG